MFTLNQVVPWGRSYDEYQRMFALTEADLQLRILGCADGPAGFNALATRRGTNVVSVDPIYQWSALQIQERIAATFDEILDQTRRNSGEFVWDTMRSVERLGEVRMAAMQEFLEDFEQGKAEGRYVEAELPALPLPDDSFDLTLCSHFLFLYSEQLGERFHQEAICEMCRVSREIRIFPLLALGAKPSPYVGGVLEHLRAEGHHAAIETVPYEFQRGGNRMMRIRTVA